MNDLNSLYDMMQRAGANMEDAIKKGDRGRAERNQKMVNRLTAVAEAEINKRQGQQANMPTEPKIPTPEESLAAQRADIDAQGYKSDFSKPPAQKSNNTGPSQMFGNWSVQTSPQIPKSDYVGGVRGSGNAQQKAELDQLESQRQASVDKIPFMDKMGAVAEDTDKQFGTDFAKTTLPDVGKNALRYNPFTGLPMAAYDAVDWLGTTKEGKNVTDTLQGNKPLLQGIKEYADQGLFKSDADVEKKLGSPAVLGAEGVKDPKTSLPSKYLPANPNTRLRDTKGGADQLYEGDTITGPGEKYEEYGGRFYPGMPETLGNGGESENKYAAMRKKVDEAMADADTPEQFIGQLKNDEPSLFSGPESILTMLFFGSKGLFHTYDQKQTNFRQKREIDNHTKLAGMKKEGIDPIKWAELGLKEKEYKLKEHESVLGQKNKNREFDAGITKEQMRAEENKSRDTMMSPSILPRMDKIDDWQKNADLRMKALFDRLDALRAIK